MPLKYLTNPVHSVRVCVCVDVKDCMLESGLSILQTICKKRTNLIQLFEKLFKKFVVNEQNLILAQFDD